ncbi:Golgi-associated plant pathogenesis-related protein 1 isoform X2 [Struthio camelus]|uniref:Golgi-associated plant pathogenesis-related protein 1 isoform X2 n=1 Tax=Struthio camelus TaxID=8801 RepID=UPI003603AE88
MGKSASKQFAEEVLKAHNDYRKKHGVPPLKLCKKLNRGAQQYAEELATTRVLKHSSESANGKCGENLAWASYDQPGSLTAQHKTKMDFFGKHHHPQRSTAMYCYIAGDGHSNPFTARSQRKPLTGAGGAGHKDFHLVAAPRHT